MKPPFLSRFQEIRNLKTSHGCQVFVASDEVLEKKNVLVKIFPTKYFNYDVERLTKFLSWYRGVHYPHLATIFDTGLTPKKDFYYVREYLPAITLRRDRST